MNAGKDTKRLHHGNCIFLMTLERYWRAYTRAAHMDVTLGKVDGEVTVRGCGPHPLRGSRSIVKQTEIN